MNEQLKEKLKCSLPFYGFADLHKKCTEILLMLNEYQKQSSISLKEQGIEFGDMIFGHFINVDDLNEEQKKWFSESKEWEIFYKAFAEKFNIIDENNVLQIG